MGKVLRDQLEVGKTVSRHHWQLQSSSSWTSFSSSWPRLNRSVSLIKCRRRYLLHLERLQLRLQSRLPPVCVAFLFSRSLQSETCFRLIERTIYFVDAIVHSVEVVVRGG